MKTFRKSVVIFMAMLATACVNPLNQATSDRYSQSCAEAERNRQLDIAEQACYRALVNVALGNLGEAQKSQKMYNLARIKRHIRKFDEAEKLYKESLAIEEKQTPVSQERIGRRSAELAIIYGEQKRFEEGLPFVERLVPLADSYQGDEKRAVAAIFYIYSQELPQETANDVRSALAQKAVEMGYDPKSYKK